jgi:hypothetical protein
MSKHALRRLSSSALALVVSAMFVGACEPETNRTAVADPVARNSSSLDECVPDWTSCRDVGLCGHQLDGCRWVNCGPCSCTSIPCTEMTLSCELPAVHCYAEGLDCCGYGL